MFESLPERKQLSATQRLRLADLEARKEYPIGTRVQILKSRSIFLGIVTGYFDELIFATDLRTTPLIEVTHDFDQSLGYYAPSELKKK